MNMGKRGLVEKLKCRRFCLEQEVWWKDPAATEVWSMYSVGPTMIKPQNGRSGGSKQCLKCPRMQWFVQTYQIIITRIPGNLRRACKCSMTPFFTMHVCELVELRQVLSWCGVLVENGGYRTCPLVWHLSKHMSWALSRSDLALSTIKQKTKR